MDFATEKLNAVTDILRASQSIQEIIRKDAARYELNPTEFAVLELLFQVGDQPIQVIGKKVLISSSSITYVVDKLEQKKYVIRKACPEDRRVTYASLTSLGKTLMERIYPQHVKMMDGIFCRFTEADLNKMVQLIKKIE
ncbi:MarR family transcriptional regulator, 2-MHQ and catechol-resistance regulon repressor [Psychrobacillus sp. OK028]|uniref:MarR family winged helix-turn-helix transcriptional regulator n=1 Tax=Psychrobacillus sp. OK028 TaxID=1884359 RepID=UPI000880A9F8|nr:MarR family transcriptional regulator [Psychrobacillus sp. OK028]SDN55837.1 MarR family transcriptional regulator, 2-MHQ and catechol-resistance regulon repressor [Psychrobacillus sp. OK028]